MNRRSLIGIVLLALAGPGVARAGDIRGTVRAEGVQLPESASAGDGNYGSRKYRFLERINYDEIKEFVVFIEGPVVTDTGHADDVVRVVVQENGMFSPHVMPVRVGTTVEWPNEDDIFHNVFSFSDPEPFDLGLYKDEVKRIHFDQPGRVDVFCSIHKNMNCIILVLENRYFAKTDASGHFRISGVPGGTYQLKAWHERLPPQTLDVTVHSEGTVTADFVLGIKGIPRY